MAWDVFQDSSRESIPREQIVQREGLSHPTIPNLIVQILRAFPALTILQLGNTGIRDEEQSDEEQSGLPDPATKMQRCLGC
jgi:hypothetical protein